MRPTYTDEAVFTAAHERLEELLPGEGPLASEAEACAYLERWALMTPQWWVYMIRFLTQPNSRTYVITHPAGRELCRSYVADEPARFRRLLTEQLRVRDLLAVASDG